LLLRKRARYRGFPREKTAGKRWNWFVRSKSERGIRHDRAVIVASVRGTSSE
jgi:hypothetical protein